MKLFVAIVRIIKNGANSHCSTVRTACANLASLSFFVIETRNCQGKMGGGGNRGGKHCLELKIYVRCSVRQPTASIINSTTFMFVSFITLKYQNISQYKNILGKHALFIKHLASNIVFINYFKRFAYWKEIIISFATLCRIIEKVHI